MPVLLPSLISQPTPGEFPDADLELTCEAAFGADLTADPDQWEFTDLSVRVIDAPITVQRGVVVGGRTQRTSSTTVQLLNTDGWLTAHHPGSPWWPHVDLGTPMRVSVRTRTAPYLADTFTRTVASGWGTVETTSAGGGTSWLNTSGLSVSGGAARISCTVLNSVYTSRIFKIHRDVDITYDVSCSAVTTGGPLATGPTLRASTSNADHSWPLLEFQPDGTLRWALWKRLGGTYTQLTTATIPGSAYAAGTVIRVRFLLIGARLRAKAWLAASVEPSGWSLDYTFTDAVLIAEGRYFGISAWPISTLTTPLPITVTVDNLSIGQPRYPRIEGYIADVRTSFVPAGDGDTHSVAVVDIGGVGTRLELRDSDAWSPMRRSIQWGDADPVAYWHCEDGERSTQAASGITGQPPLQVTGPAVFSFDTGEPEDTLISTYGSKNLCSVAAGARLSTTFAPSPVQDEWTVGITAQVIAALVPVAEIRMLEWSTFGTFSRWALVSTSTGHAVRAYNDTAGTTTTVCSSVNGVNALAGFDVQAVQNGGNIDVTLLLDTVVYATGSVAGTLGAPQAIEVNPDRANTTGSTSPFGIRWLAGHVVVHDSATASSLPYYFDGPTLLRADRGWYGEPSHLRAARVAEEGRVPFRLVAAPDEDTRLNAQQEGGTVELITAAVDAESGGLLFEDGFGYALLPRTARYSQAPALTIDLAEYARSGGTDPGEVLQPVLDVRSPTVWTVERTAGSQAVWAAAEAYRKRRGTIPAKATLDLYADTDALPHAQWRTHLTEDVRGGHYPGAVVDLAANPGLIDDWLLCDIGARVQRVNQPTVAGLGIIDQVVEGVSETLGRRMWQASIDGAPASVWDVGLYDDDTWLADSVSTTLVADQPATSVGASESWQISTALLGDVWETVDVGYVWGLNGEEITVTAMSAVTGSGPYLQTATVTRGSNGIVKAHSAGDLIQLADPAIYSL